MDRGLFRYDEPYGYDRPRRRTNYFAWAIAILLLTGFAFAAWLGSFYIIGQPERPDSYRILKKLHKIEPPKRFELTAAPAGEFLNAQQLYERYSAMGAAELARTSSELTRNYIRNYQQVRGLVPYVVGRYTVMETRELGNNDIFAEGMAALTISADRGELLMEHVYPAEPQVVPLMKQTLNIGLEIKLERTHDLSVIIHVERLGDGRLLITAIPLLYGTYTVTRGTGTFSLEPPMDLNLEAGWPVFKDPTRRKAEIHFATYRQQSPAAERNVPVPGLAPSGSPPPAENTLVRVEQAMPVEPPKVAVAQPKIDAKATPTPKGKKLAKNQKATPTPAPAIAQQPVVPSPTPMALAMASPQPTVAEPPKSTPSIKSPVVSAQPVAPQSERVTTAPPAPVENAVPVLPAQPVPADASGNALASIAGGGTWKTFAPGKMPLGRLINTNDLKDLAEHGVAGERVYLKGQFVVNFADANRAVLRPRAKLTDTVLHFGAGSSTRIIVDFPAGYTPPAQGATVSRDEARPYEITEVRKQDDGQLNVFVREIMQ
jgi:hypothetical protein